MPPNWEIVYISKPEIWKLADKMRRWATKDVNSFPVNMEKLIEILYKIDLVPEKGLLEMSGIEGFLSWDMSTIYIDAGMFMDNRYQNRLRFTLAHEIGHYELHREAYKSFRYQNAEEFVTIQSNMPDHIRNSFETQAKEFAGRLLVPSDPLIEAIIDHSEQIEEQLAINRLMSDWDLSQSINDSIALRFGVSANVVSMRIWKEGIDLKTLIATPPSDAVSKASKAMPFGEKSEDPDGAKSS